MRLFLAPAVVAVLVAALGGGPAGGPDPRASSPCSTGETSRGGSTSTPRPDTWSVREGLLVCSGKPIGVMRSEKQYENFVLHVDHAPS